MNPTGIRRQMKNLVHNYTDPQVKVREATSNDPWGPSSTLMGEIADLTYNVVAFTEIMQVIWKRLNDHGKNWRHVYKGLVLLDYLIKTGSEKVAQQCRENIFAVQTLKDFQYIEDNKDQGMNVREKAKQLVALLKDDERLRNERARALKAKERFAQATAGIGHEAQTPGAGTRLDNSQTDYLPPRTELETARPQTAGEEELQLQLALAMSKEEAEQEEQKRRSDDVRLQMAITQSEEDFRTHDKVQSPSSMLGLLDSVPPVPVSPISSRGAAAAAASDPWGMPVNQPLPVPPLPPTRQQNESSLDELMGLNLSSSYTSMPRSDMSTDVLLPVNNKSSSSDPWGVPVASMPMTSLGPGSNDPWSTRPASSLGVPTTAMKNDPWNSNGGTIGNGVSLADPWSTTNSNTSFGSTPSLATNGDMDTFDPLGLRPASSKSTNNIESLMDTSTPAMNLQKGTKKTPESFLGENSSLVNLDSLVSTRSETTPSIIGQNNTNPFASQANPFQLQQARLSLNQMRHQQVGFPGPMMTGPQMPPPMMTTMSMGMGPVPATMTGPQPITSNPFL